MVLETRNQRKRVQAAMSPKIIAKISEEITLDQARDSMRIVTRKTVYHPWSRAITAWCSAMEKSMAALQGSKHFDTDFWLRSDKTQDAIRNSLCKSNKFESKKLFCFEKLNSHINGYFAFRPVSADKTDEVYSLLACMKVLSDANDHEYKHYVRLYKWIEREMALSTRQETRKD